MVEQFGKGFGKPVGEGLDHDGSVWIVGQGQLRGEFVRTVNADDEATEVILLGAGCHPVGQRDVGFAGVFVDLLAQAMQTGAFRAARVIRPYDQVVALSIGREKSVHAARHEAVLR